MIKIDISDLDKSKLHSIGAVSTLSEFFLTPSEHRPK
jgi:hypothetical protein